MNELKTNKRNLHYIFYALTLVTGLWLGVFLSNGKYGITDRTGSQNVSVSKITDIFRYIEENYVDSVQYHKLVENALASIMLNLDPHSSYIPLEEFQLMSEQMTGNFEGIGIQFRIEKDTVYVVQTIANGPSEKVGVKAGDRIVEVDEKNVAGTGISNNEVMKMLRGKKGTTVKLGILRGGIPGVLYFTIIRDVIPTYSIDFSGMISPEIGYIKLSSFNFSSDKEFRDALDKLNARGMKKLIFDLRGNGGGSLDACINIADQFFDKGVLLVYTEGLHRIRKNVYSSRNGLFKQGELVILVDEFSASASEIIAGAVQDNDRGTIIGRRSFGKGLVQEQISFRDGSAIRLTVARYYTPVGRSIQRKYEMGVEAYYDEFYNRVMEDLKTGNDTARYDTIEYRTKSGKIVYGGGGIMPDIHVAYPAYYKNDSIGMYFSLLFQFTFDYSDKNRSQLLNRYRNAQGFINNFSVSQQLWSDYLEYIRKNSTQKKDVRFPELKPEEKTLIQIYLKANIGRNLFDYECYYPIIKDADEILKTAILYLDNNKEEK
jgi:carboxyl-terminal processing protease